MNVIDILRATAARAAHRSLDFCPKALSPTECIKSRGSSCTLSVKSSSLNGFTCDVVKDSRMETICSSIHVAVGCIGLGSGCLSSRNLGQSFLMYHQWFHPGSEDLWQSSWTKASRQLLPFPPSSSWKNCGQWKHRPLYLFLVVES